MYAYYRKLYYLYQIAEARVDQNADKLLDLKKQVHEEVVKNKDAEKVN